MMPSQLPFSMVPKHPHSDLFPGNSQMHAFMRNFDWSASPLGSPDTWPQSLRTLVSFLLDAKFPIGLSWGPDLRLLYNDAYLHMAGNKHPAAFGARMQDAWQEIWPEMAPIVQRTLNGKSSYFENFPASILRNNNPEQCWFTFSYSPVRDDDNRVAGLMSIASETTAQVFAAERHAFQIRLSDHLRALSDATAMIAQASALLGQRLGVARVGYIEFDEAEQALAIAQDWTNGELPTLAGKTLSLEDFGSWVSDELRAGRVLRITDTETDQRCMPFGEAYAAVGVRAALGIPLFKNDRLRAVLHIHQTNVRQWSALDVALAQDMVERTWAAVESARSHAELRTERDQSQYIFDGMTEGFVIYGPDWTVLQINAGGARIIRRPISDIVGRKLWDIWPSMRGSRVETLYRQVRKTGLAGIIEAPYTFSDGRKIWLERRVYPALHGGLGVFFRDITERKEAEKKLRDADRRKDEFLAMLAHELRNPLAPIRTAVELLSLVKLDEKRVQKTSEIIGRQVDHMTSLINDLLDVSRVTRGLVKLEKTPLDIQHIVTDAVEQVNPLIQSRRHHLALQLSPEPAIVLGDDKRLVQVVANLLNNAAKYTPEGGHLRLTTEVREEKILLSMTDDGIGMEPELAAHVFELFAQAERTPDRSSGGLGLGLALVKSMVELHGGSVGCASEGRGKGSRFTVCLPRLPLQAEPAALLPAGSRLQRPKRSLQILVVDDNADAARTLAMLLEAAGHQVRVKSCAQAALEEARAEPPDVCLLDIGLPEVNGNELARRLRSRPETADTVLIAITGYGQPFDRERALAAGFHHYFVKPVDSAKLMALLADIGS
jgi:PAS domain S-box-containing protein